MNKYLGVAQGQVAAGPTWPSWHVRPKSSSADSIRNKGAGPVWIWGDGGEDCEKEGGAEVEGDGGGLQGGRDDESIKSGEDGLGHWG